MSISLDRLGVSAKRVWSGARGDIELQVTRMALDKILLDHHVKQKSPPVPSNFDQSEL
jgi:hypothetical protein